MKKLLSLLAVSAMVVSLCACSNGETTKENAETTESSSEAETGTEATDESTGVMPAIAKEDIKVGVIHITDPAEGSGYTYTHDLGIQGMQSNIGLDDSQIVRKNKRE